MADKSYQALLDSYQKTLDQVKHLEEMQHLCKAENDALHREKETEETLIREFCIEILSGNGDEIAEEKSRQWNKLDIPSLLGRARAALEAKDSDWLEKYKELFQKVEIRRVENETLKEQLKKCSEGESQHPAHKEEPKTGIQYIRKEEDDILDSAEDALLMEASKMNRATCLREGALKVLEDEKSAQKKRNLKKKQDKDIPVHVNLQEYEKIFQDPDWCFIRCIGEKGLCSFTDISREAMLIDPGNKDRRIRSSAGLVTSHGITEYAMITTPKGRMALYNLTSKGKELYRLKYKSNAVMSEWERLVNEHTSLAHGYGIKIIADILRESPYYKVVDEFQRTKGIKLAGGKKYVPDILCIDEKNQKMFIEYELNTCSQQDFNNKCERMMEASKYMNFIVPNHDECTVILDRINKWIQGKKQGVLSRHTIRVTTFSHSQKTDLWQNESWKYVIQPSNSFGTKGNY